MHLFVSFILKAVAVFVKDAVLYDVVQESDNCSTGSVSSLLHSLFIYFPMDTSAVCYSFYSNSKLCEIHTDQAKYSSSIVSNQSKYSLSQLITFTFLYTHGSRGVLTEVSWASRLLCLLLNIRGHNFTLAAEFIAVGDLCLNQLAKMRVQVILDGVYSHCYCCSPSSQFNFTDFPFKTLQNHKMWCEVCDFLHWHHRVFLVLVLHYCADKPMLTGLLVSH